MEISDVLHGAGDPHALGLPQPGYQPWGLLKSVRGLSHTERSPRDQPTLLPQCKAEFRHARLPDPFRAERVAHAIERFHGGALEEHTTLPAQQQNLVHPLRQPVETVLYHNDSALPFPRQRPQVCEELGRRGRVQVGRRFVQHQDARPHRHDRGESHALFLTAGEPRQVPLAETLQARLAQGPVDPLSRYRQVPHRGSPSRRPPRPPRSARRTANRGPGTPGPTSVANTCTG